MEDAVRELVAGLGEDRLRLCGVVGELVRELLVQPGLERGRDDARLVSGGLVAVLADLRHACAVDRVRHRPAYRNVLENRIFQVDEDRDVRDGREPVVVVLAP